jgi:hypothetical protein
MTSEMIVSLSVNQVTRWAITDVLALMLGGHPRMKCVVWPISKSGHRIA